MGMMCSKPYVCTCNCIRYVVFNGEYSCSWCATICLSKYDCRKIKNCMPVYDVSISPEN